MLFMKQSPTHETPPNLSRMATDGNDHDLDLAKVRFSDSVYILYMFHSDIMPCFLVKCLRTSKMLRFSQIFNLCDVYHLVSQ